MGRLTDLQCDWFEAYLVFRQEPCQSSHLSNGTLGSVRYVEYERVFQECRDFFFESDELPLSHFCLPKHSGWLCGSVVDRCSLSHSLRLPVSVWWLQIGLSS